MRALHKLALTSICLIFTLLPLKAQKKVIVEGEYYYVAPATESFAEAKRVSIQKAKLDALAKRFGTDIRSVSTIMQENGESFFENLSSTEVKGVWVDDLIEPEITLTKVDINEGFTLKVKVKGHAREVKSSLIDIKAEVLKNGTRDSYKSDSFESGDIMYLSFSTPVPGYLTVYLLDSEDRTVYCLLPYHNDSDGIVQVSNNKKYIFFSPKDDEDGLADTYRLTCQSPSIVDEICIVFSPNKFYKANDSMEDDKSLLPRELTTSDFHDWLGKLKSRDDQVQVIYKPITITK